MVSIGKPPCDEGVVRAGRASAPCTPASAPWVLEATIIGSAMVFIDGTITNVALSQIQEHLGATAAAKHAAGHAFYQAADGVWPTDHVPPG